MAKRGLVGDWDKAERLLRELPRIAENNMRLATKQNAITARDDIRKTIRQGRPEWPPLSDLTIQRKGSSRPLTDYGDLAFSVVEQVVSQYGFFVGVPRTAQNKSGQRMMTIATAMERGAVIRPKRARALAIPVSREASRLVSQYGSVRAIPGIFRPHGTSILALPDGDGFKMMFILRQSVKIPARSFLESTMRDSRPKLQKHWRHAAQMTMKGKTLLG